MGVKLSEVGKGDYSVLNIELDGMVEPGELKGLQLPVLDYKKGVVINGRAPIWLYGALIHELHPAIWVGVNDPRLGVVVVMSHTNEVGVGDILDLEI